MKRMYSAVFEEIAVTTAQDLIEIRISNTALYVVVIHSVSISQSSDVGDAEAEELNILMHIQQASGSGGTTITPNPMEIGTPAFSGTVTRNNTTQASRAGAYQRLSDNFNIFQGYYKQFSPRERIIAPWNNASIALENRFILSLDTVPADSLTMSCTIVFEEM